MEVHKIMCACGNGIGSSLMVEMNINSVLNTLGRTDIEVTHTTISEVKPGVADLYVFGRDLANFVDGIEEDRLVVLNNIIDKNELTEKLGAKLG
ncbi:PTS sugar transporter subunit IIB [Paratractidigestivibacter sp.]|uniref:PTS sugar transporter subunit IIB n=1 Tax=Paratractidigestivibacter sp. TaxID=2847316 RepID=UPI002ABE2C70|nr:PTS sugar transporter subunit IIB [Paratractidigestivibacter sp.]